MGPPKDALDLLRQMMAILAGVLTGPMDSAALKRLPKIRQKAWREVPTLLELAIKKPEYSAAGEDPSALLQEYWLVASLQILLSNVGGARKGIGDTFRKREADLWKSILVIYGVMSAQAGKDQQVAQVVASMGSAMSNGPRAQKSVKAHIPPTPVKGKKAKDVLLAAARAEAGIPEATATPPAPTQVGPVVARVAPPVVSPVAVTPPPAPSPAVSNGVANGSANGSGHSG